MEAAGLANRSPAPVDGRVVTVHVTDEGRRLHGLVSERRAKIVYSLLEEFEPAEREVFVDHVDRFVMSIERYVAAAGRTPPAAVDPPPHPTTPAPG